MCRSRQLARNPPTLCLLVKKGTQLMAIYTPYFYIIQDTRNDMYYAGSKWAQGCHPDQLLKEGGYPTSSEKIKKIIDENGLNTFIIRKIRTFETGDEAYNYETRFLVKINAKNNPKFYNGHDNDYHIFAYHDKKYKEMMLEKYGVEYPMQSEEIKTKTKQTNLKRYGVENVSQVPEVSKKMSDGIRKTMQSEEWKNTKGVESKNKLSITLNSREWKDTKGIQKSKKISEAKKGKCTGENNSNYGNKWSDEQKEKMSEKHSGKKHPQYGWIWITNGEISRKINPDKEKIPEDWYRGRASRRSKVICSE